MMTNKNVLLVATMLVALSSTIEARLQGHTHRVSSTKQQQRQRELNEEEDDKILVAMEKEYREDEASKQKAYEKAMASHNKMVPDKELREEVNSLDQDFAKKEEHAQAQAHAEQEEKEKEQAKATVVVDIDGLDSIVKMKKEFKDYEDVQQQKKKIAADDKKLIRQVKQANLALEKQNKDMAAQAHVHQLENDKVALVYHEASILELQMIEQQAQDEAMHEQLAEETILQKEEEEQMHLHRRKMELLMA
mmetsp:Transcript_55525/g.61990  ORF Transcript_55525/g.61990 Transcript_55525/m.61990 type:complete len:249 (+) Transcript_55525:215-961(+)